MTKSTLARLSDDSKSTSFEKSKNLDLAIRISGFGSIQHVLQNPMVPAATIPIIKSGEAKFPIEDLWLHLTNPTASLRYHARLSTNN
ncbi:hypothetical protein EAF00_010447 [Botryotinia globosa]|nr:hypothetical protein EAF00_010447 [Botryotinia globosa]